VSSEDIQSLPFTEAVPLRSKGTPEPTYLALNMPKAVNNEEKL